MNKFLAIIFCFTFQVSYLSGQGKCDVYRSIPYIDSTSKLMSFYNIEETLRVYSDGFYEKSTLTGFDGSGQIKFELGYFKFESRKIILYPFYAYEMDRNVGWIRYLPDYRSLILTPRELLVQDDRLIDSSTVNSTEIVGSDPVFSLLKSPLSIYRIDTTFLFYRSSKDDRRNSRFNRKFSDSDFYHSYFYSPIILSGNESIERKVTNYLELATEIERVLNDQILMNDSILTNEKNGTLVGVYDKELKELRIYQNNLIAELKELEKVIHEICQYYDSKIIPFEMRKYEDNSIEVRK